MNALGLLTSPPPRPTVLDVAQTHDGLAMPLGRRPAVQVATKETTRGARADRRLDASLVGHIGRHVVMLVSRSLATPTMCRRQVTTRQIPSQALLARPPTTAYLATGLARRPKASARLFSHNADARRLKARPRPSGTSCIPWPISPKDIRPTASRKATACLVAASDSPFTYR